MIQKDSGCGPAAALANRLNHSARCANPGGRILFQVEREGVNVVVRVRDTGIGIPEAMLTRVFEMFTPVDRLQRFQESLVPGLTLVQRLVQKHGGAVAARSAGPQTGSEVIVLASTEAGASGGRAADKRNPVSSPDPPLPSHLERMPMLDKESGEGLVSCRRILLADDNRDAAESLALLLQVSGHETCVAFDGQEALDKAQVWRPDVALLDIGMPKLTGHEVARRLRAQPEFHDLMLVALTGWGQEDDRRRSREAGFDHHLVKPCDLALLHSLLSAPPEAS